jgi:hypothetical protein
MSPVDNSSRTSESGAGWTTCAGPGTWAGQGTPPKSWLRPSVLVRSRNDIVARVLADPIDAARAQWVERMAGSAPPDLVIRREVRDRFSVLVVGDAGEGDDSQFAVVPTLMAALGDGAPTDFTLLCSDVVYPTGDLRDYLAHHFQPYQDLPVPCYAIPGNHDWYDGLHGFMRVFCGATTPDLALDFGPGPRALAAKLLWRRNKAISAAEFDAMRVLRSAPEQQCVPPQPGPYYAIDAGPVRFVCIDTGITGRPDPAQPEWLAKVSYEDERPKVLFTGKPIYVNGEYHPGSVDHIVTSPKANYKLVIGGDTHNYQRYPVRLADGRTIQYVVSGGGGAYLHATHWIPQVDVNGVREEDFRCYPLRRDSLARFSQVIDRKLFRGKGLVEISAPQAARYFERHWDINSQARRPAASGGNARQQLTAAVLRRIRFGRLFHRFGSELFDFNDPPLFKQFVRLEITNTDLTLVCYGVTGCEGTETTLRPEDQITVAL